MQSYLAADPFFLLIPNACIDLKCITKLKAMQQKSIAAFEGRLCHMDQMWKSLDFLHFPTPQCGHLSVSDSFQSTPWMKSWQAGFVCQRQKNLFLSIESLCTRTVELDLANCTSTMSTWPCATNPCTPCPRLLIQAVLVRRSEGV